MEGDGLTDPDAILRKVRQIQFTLRVTREYKIYIAICGIFGPQRNIVKHWDTYEPVFQILIEEAESMGQKHLLQAIILFFINKYPQLQKYAPALCSKLYENSVIESDVFT